MGRTLVLWASALALAAGCGKGDPALQSGPPPTIPLDPPDAPPPPPADPAVPCDGLVTVRLEGSGVPAGQTVRLGVSRVTVIADGALVESRFAATGDVVFPVAGAYRLAVVRAPPHEASVTVLFTGGQVCDGGGCKAIASCGAPLVAVFDGARVRAGVCHVVLDLDLGRSILPAGDGFATLLDYRLGY